MIRVWERVWCGHTNSAKVTGLEDARLLPAFWADDTYCIPCLEGTTLCANILGFPRAYLWAQGTILNESSAFPVWLGLFEVSRFPDSLDSVVRNISPKSSKRLTFEQVIWEGWITHLDKGCFDFQNQEFCFCFILLFFLKLLCLGFYGFTECVRYLYVNSAQAKVLWEEGTSTRKMSS